MQHKIIINYLVDWIREIFPARVAIDKLSVLDRESRKNSVIFGENVDDVMVLINCLVKALWYANMLADTLHM